MTRIHLIDTNSAVVGAWQRSFVAEPDVKIGCADILSVAHGALVSLANGGGHMDGGIDAAYLLFFGQRLQERVYQAVTSRPEGLLPVGVAALVPTGHARIPYLIVAPMMEVPGEVSAMNAYRAFKAVLRLVARSPAALAHVFCPGLASGIGSVAPEEAAAETHRALLHVRERP